jgi:hypothetical protein
MSKRYSSKKTRKPVASLSNRFHAKFKVDPDSGCWLWTGSINGGYGHMGLWPRYRGLAKAHRVSWQLYRGEVPEGALVLHRCNVRRCVNPDHLYLGTPKDNAQDALHSGTLYKPDNRGARHGCAKLTEKAVRHIKRREMSGAEYASLYGVSRAQVYVIWLGKAWKSITNP